MALHVVDEAKRCLNCKKPLCQVKGCPIKTPIPEMIQAFLGGEINKAGEMLFENNPLSLICSLICDHEKQCEGHCVLNHKGMPIHISSIEHYISDNYLSKLKTAAVSSKKGRIGIIGSGPAGLTIAILLAQRGYQITIFEGKDKIGGVLRYGIPEFRLPKSILDRYENLLVDMGIKIRPNTAIGTAIGVDEMIRDGYDAIFIGTGIWKPNTLGIKGETLGNVHYAINYLSNPDVYHLGDTVAVIGAGNAAMDVARTALREGARQVTVFARGNKAAASKRELEYAQIDGVKFEYNKAPVEFTDEGVILQDIERDETGAAVFVEGTQKLYRADSTIISVSQGPRNRIVSTTTGLDVTQRGLLVTDQKGETTRPGIYAAGDIVFGAKTVVEAAAYSKLVADAMDEYVQNKNRDQKNSSEERS
ncbi:NAD(P)-dependent oxidoreductase [Anoxybacterium hadale]|uniref:NAD(P)-dependent oxidoreductase n=1 Tax=Anoxybacterium hadale TaxID=3408580 RepID=A0ACD1A6E3_9FIRM|nr:NAD(P)-dependent oxidoreductase [Clostridiales bacterium]